MRRPPAARSFNVTFAGFRFRGPGESDGRRIYCVTDDAGLSATVYCAFPGTDQAEWEAVPQDKAETRGLFDAALMIRAAQWHQAQHDAAHSSDLEPVCSVLETMLQE